MPCDLAQLDTDTVSALAESISSHYGNLQGLVHCASMLGPKIPLVHYPADQWQTVMQTNVNAVLNQGLFDLLDQGDPAVSCFIRWASRAVPIGAPIQHQISWKGLAKFSLTKPKRQGKCVYSVNPGGTRTAMRREAYPLEDP